MATPTPINRLILERSLRHAVYLARLRNGEAEAIRRLLTSVLPDLTQEIERRVAAISSPGGYAPSSQRILRLRQLRQFMNEQIRAIDLLGNLEGNLTRLVLTESEFQVRMLQAITPADIAYSFRQPPVTLLRSIVSSRPFEGQLLREWTENHGISTTNRTMRAINLGLTRGESIQDITTRVRGQLVISRNEAMTITRTAVNHVSAQARELTYAENDDIVKGVQWVSTLDGRTSMTCMSLDGQVFPNDSGPRPPAHFNCRSTTVPVLKSWQELGIDAADLGPSTRASMNGQVSDKLNYDEWLRTQPSSFQNEVLGPARAKLFRDGKRINTFVDDQFRPLSLADIRRREGLD